MTVTVFGSEILPATNVSPEYAADTEYVPGLLNTAVAVALLPDRPTELCATMTVSRTPLTKKVMYPDTVDGAIPLGEHQVTVAESVSGVPVVVLEADVKNSTSDQLGGRTGLPPRQHG